ncbi:MAG: alkaline phosphatase family protein [Acidobacteriota bacterium]|jgi:predicted AlkP superfamily phosphohydrolase/phosphomutase
MTSRRWLLLTGSVVWTLLAVWGAVLVARHRPLTIELDGGPLFVSGAGELLALWGLGVVALLIPWLPAGAPRRTAWALWGAAILGTALWVVAVLSPDRPEASPEPAEASEPAGAAAAVPGAERTTLLVAVDGMSWTAALPMVHRGELPHLARLMEEGSYGVLHSLRTYREKVDKWGYWSPVVWTSLATGVRPERHGITDFTLPAVRGTGNVAATTHRRAAAFWNLFSAFDRRVGVVGWWATWPAEEVSGYMASSHLGLRGHRGAEPVTSGLTYPPELVEELPREVASPRELRDWVHEAVFPFHHYPVLTDAEASTMYSVLWQDRSYLDMTKYLIDRERLDLYAVYFEGIDALSHHFWRAMAAPEEDVVPALPQGFRDHQVVVPNYYRVIDSYLGELLDHLPEDATILIVSDHGFQLDDEHAKGADHSPYGVIVARGPGIAAGRNLNLNPLGSLRELLHDRTDVLDVLPTLLYLHGLPVAEDLSGRVLGDLLTGELRETQPLLHVRSYGNFAVNRRVEVEVDPAMSKEYEERLRALGYID